MALFSAQGEERPLPSRVWLASRLTQGSAGSFDIDMPLTGSSEVRKRGSVLSSTNIVGATWEIRQGISEGNGGTIIASVMTATPNVTPTGCDGFGFIEQMVEVDALDVFLPAEDYFLNVTPTGDLSGRSFDSSTMGANCIGTPCGNDQNAFFDSPFFGAVFTSTANEGQSYDFSMSVNGDVHGGGGRGITQTAAASRKHYGNADDFDVTLPRGGMPQGGTFLQTFVFTFSEDVTSISGASTTTCGRVTSTTFSDDTVTVQLGHVNCDGSDITVNVAGVNGASSSVDASGTMTLRVADVNADGVIDTAYINEIRMHIGRGEINGDNFRDDITVDGHINHGDISLAKTMPCVAKRIAWFLFFGRFRLTNLR
jgi:hypothetical protein